MKSIFTYLVGFSLLTLTTLSCSKDKHYETRQQAVAPQVITADVPAGQTYVLNMGVGTTATIQTQARHYQLSEIAASNGNTVYKYTALKGYAGTDEVTLLQSTKATSMAQGGGCHNGNHNPTNEQYSATFKTIAIKFNVGN